MTVVYLFCLCFLFFLSVHSLEVATHIPENVAKILNDSRRIIHGNDVTDGRPYMVYLKLPRTNKKVQNYRTWLCGGVIIHEEYILTSAACIEDAEHFYVVSGTYKYADEDDRYNNPCIKNGAKKAIWKCIPKNYIFDGHENDNIRWMNNDIAVVKIEDGFDFNRRIRGCEFVPKPICYNNQTQTLENPGTVVTISGWGTTSRYNDWINRRRENQQNLLEAHVEIIPKNRCKRRWGSRYHNIIDNYMVCTKDIGQTMSEICNEKYVDCQDISYSDDEDARRDLKIIEKVPTNLTLHSAYNDSRRYASQADGGFCENDHGGPLVYGTGVNSVVIGVISACLVKERTNKCYGPFLYTSVYKNRQFISCAIYKDLEPKCRRQFRSGVTHEEKVLSWKNHPDGPAKNELDTKSTVPDIVQRASEDQVVSGDKVFPDSGFIIKANTSKSP
uniref:Seminal fluid protein HACP038 n=1 Tax=Heliconius melpomene TaxID=34740 RepID=D9HQ88_HELME